MNENFISVMYPPFPSSATHVVTNTTFFYDASEDNIPPIGKSPTKNIGDVVQIGDEVTLIEYGIGFKGQWSKILLKDKKLVYVLSEDLRVKEELEKIYPGVKNISGPLYPFTNTKEYLPDYKSAKINWREQKPNIVYEDKYNGKLCVHYEYSEVTEVENDDDLKNRIKLACVAGTKLILNSKGIKVSDKLINGLIDNFLFFSKAEEYYFPLRKCSTLRVLVTLPTRFLYSVNLLLSDESAVEDPNSELANLDPNSDAANGDSPEETNNDLFLVYNSKDELDVHFSTIATNLLNIFGLFTFPPSKTWTIEPKTTPDIIPVLGAVDLLAHQQRMGDLHKLINEFIYNNLLEQSKLHSEGLENYKKVFGTDSVQKTDTNNWFSITDAITLKKSTSANYEGKVHLSIDKVNLVLKDVKFFTLDDKEIPLNVGRDKFFNEAAVKNKTSLNYLCKIQPYTALTEAYVSWKEENNTTLLKVSNIDKLVSKIIDQLFSIKSNVDESQVRNFLLTYHYPTITSVKSTDLPISFSCSDISSKIITYEERLNSIRFSQSPREKLRVYNQLVKDAQNIKINEGSNFAKYAVAPNLVNDPNVKILLGAANLSPDEEFAINQFMMAASSVDWPRFLQEAVNCAGIKFDARQFTNILNEFDRAKHLLETCNPIFSNNLLNQLADFALPELPDYNPNLSLIEDLKKLVLNIIKESLMFAIRKMIEDALKTCAAALAEKNGTESPANSLLAPDEPYPANLNKVKNPNEADSLMKDIFGVDNSDSPNNRNNDIDEAKAVIENLLKDIIPCLSVREMCDLLSGRTLSDEVYDFLASIINKKYSNNIGNINLALKLNSKTELVNFFKKLGAGFNLNFCSDLLDNLENNGQIPSKPLCDDGSRKAKQKLILEDKGLSQEQIDNLIDDLQKTDEQNLRDVLGFLNNKDTPFNLNNVPTVLCQKGPNGEVIPPAVSLAPSMKTFGKVLDSLFKPVYDNFDSEGNEWYKNSYATISSTNKNSIKLENGKIVFNSDKPAAPPDEEKRKNAKEQMVPNYLFSKSIDGLKYENNLYSIKIDGYKEQQLETTIANDILRKKVIDENTNIYNFLETLFKDYETKVDAGLSESIKNNLQKSSVQQFFSLATAFYCTNTSVINDSVKAERLKKLFGFNDNNVSNALFADSLSIPIRDSLIPLLENADVKTFIASVTTTAIPTKASFADKEYQMALNAVNLYSNFDVSLQVDDKLQNNILTNEYNLSVIKNGIDYIKLSDSRTIDADILNYLKTFGADNVNGLSKQDIFNKFVQKQKSVYGTTYLSESVGRVREKKQIGNFISDTIGTANFKDFSELTIKEMGQNISNSPFARLVSIPIETDPSADNFKDPGDAFIKPPNLTDPKEKPKINAPLTQYMTLVIPQTATQKACNIRPHYLDIDSIKEDLYKAKEEAFCLEEIKNEKILNGKEIDTQDLSDSEPTDTQAILLDGGYRLLLRVYLHDLLLRGIAIFGFYDPQSLKNDDLFHAFMLEMIEAELRIRDNTAFNMMNSYYDNKGLSIKDIIIEELKKNVLPKMAKRINEDTNEKLAALTPPQKITLKTVDDFYKKDSKLLKIDEKTKSVYIRVNGTKIVKTSITNDKKTLTVTQFNNEFNPLSSLLDKYEEYIFYQKIYQSNATSLVDIIADFRKSKEYKLLFDFIIPKKEILSFIFISNVLANTSNKKRRDSFEMTKVGLQNSIKFMATGGAAIKPNPNNYQDMKNSDTDNMFLKFILQAAISAPISIVKGYTELTEPNIALSSNIYRVAKALVPETPSAIIPAISLPLGIPIPPVFPLGIVPWVNIPLSLFYLISGIWLDLGQGRKDKENKTSKDLLAKLSKGVIADQPVDCNTVYNPDVVKYSFDAATGEPYYDVAKPSVAFSQANPVEQQAINEQEIIKEYQIKQMLKIGFSTDNPAPTGKFIDSEIIKYNKDQVSKILSSLDPDVVDNLFNLSFDNKQTKLKEILVAYTAATTPAKSKTQIAKDIKDLSKNINLNTAAKTVIVDMIKNIKPEDLGIIKNDKIPIKDIVNKNSLIKDPVKEQIARTSVNQIPIKEISQSKGPDASKKPSSTMKQGAPKEEKVTKPIGKGLKGKL